MKYRLLPLLMVPIFLLVSVPSARALKIGTTPSNSSLRGEAVTLSVKLSSRGVEGGTSTPVDSVRGVVGDTIDLGTVELDRNQRAELLVELPWGSFLKELPVQNGSLGNTSVTIYPADRDGRLTIRRQGILIQPFPRGIMVREILIVRNQGNGLTGFPDNPLELDLAPELNRIIPGTGMAGSDDLRKQGEVYEYRRKFPPGQSMLGVFYMIEPPGDQYTFSRTVRQSTNQLAVSVPKVEGLEVRATGLQRRDATSSSRKSQKQLEFMANDLQSGDKISLTFTGLSNVSMEQFGPGKGSPGTEKTDPADDPFERPSTFTSVSWPLMIGIGFSLLIFVGSYSYVQFHLKAQDKSGPDSDFLVTELAQLDQEFEDGAIDKPFYKRTRRRWKSKLKELEDDD